MMNHDANAMLRRYWILLLMDVRPFGFALDVAALASRREYLNLDKWLSDHANAQFAVNFNIKKIKHGTSERLDPSVEQRSMPLNPQTITMFIRMLRGW
jgi:CCR4-NOT transcription complex subunit 1